MNKFINTTLTLKDIRSKRARINFDFLVYYLCFSLVPEEYPNKLELLKITLEECHSYLSPLLYSKENAILASEVLKNRTEILNNDRTDGFSYIYELNRKILLEVNSRKYFESIEILEHEMIHILIALNNNNPEKQYNEVLSIFGEFVSAEWLSKTYNNREVFENWLIKKCIHYMSYRVFAKWFMDASLKKQSDFLKINHLANYNYLLGFIYAARLFELYHLYPTEIMQDFNFVLSGKINVIELLEKYKINLENKEVVLSLKKMIDFYRFIVKERYNRKDLHHVL